MKEKVKKLTGLQVQSLRPLWEEVFAEDQGSFTQYYFQEKAKDNVAFVIEREEEAAAMLHLTPYAMHMRAGDDFLTVPSYYLVGVATKETFRHQGYMNRLLREALHNLYEEKTPFVFLMPANPAIYRPYDFTFIYERTEYAWKPMAELTAAQADNGLSGKITARPLRAPDMKTFLAFVNKALKERYDVFTLRDEAYYIRQQLELTALEGTIFLLWKEKSICGYFLLAKEENESFIQEALMPPEGFPPILETGKKPIIMARITNVQAMLSMLRAKSVPVHVSFFVEDSILEGNCGTYDCYIEAERATVNQRGKESPSVKEVAAASAEALTAWMFGGRSAKDCFLEVPHETMDALESIHTFQKVYINEIV